MGQETKSTQQADKGLFEELLQDAVAAGRELKALIAKMRGIAKEIEAGKVPRPRRIKQIATRQAWCHHQFDVICLELAGLVGRAKREGFEQGFLFVNVNREHPEETPLELQ